MIGDLEPQQIAGTAGVLFRKAPAHLDLAAEIAAGRDAARRGDVAEPVAPEDVPAPEYVARQQHEARERALRECLPPNRSAAELGLSSLDEDQHPAELAAWLDDPKARTLILAGKTGSGKTQAAYATAVEAVRRGAVGRDRSGVERRRPLLVRAWTVNGYLAELRPDGSPEPVWKIRDRARVAELLILDDLGAETDDVTTEHVRRELVELLEYRLEQRHRTIITTNLRSAQLSQRFGDRMYSRLVERATALIYTGPDRRDMKKLTW